MNQYFNQLHPVVLFTYYAGALALILLMLHPAFLSAGLLIILLINFFQDRCRGLQRWFFFMVSTGLLILILNPIFNERGRIILYQSEHLRITLEALTYGGITALSIIGIIALFVSYNEVMTPNKLMFLFAKIMPQFAVLLMLTLRFIPLMRRRLDQISEIQRSKGVYVIGGRWKDRMKNGMLYVQTLLTYSLEEAIQTADSMKARGYGRGQRSTYEYFRLKKTDTYMMVSLIMILGLLIVGRLAGYGFLTIYPIMESMQIPFKEAFFFSGFILFLAFPLLIELGGYVRWQLLN